MSYSCTAYQDFLYETHEFILSANIPFSVQKSIQSSLLCGAEMECTIKMSDNRCQLSEKVKLINKLNSHSILYLHKSKIFLFHVSANKANKKPLRL